MTPRCRTRILPAAAAALMAAPTTLADDVILEQSCVLAADDVAVTLGEIARLEGPDAEALSSVVIRSRAGEEIRCEISIQDVRKALGAAGAHWGRINLSGRATTVRWGGLDGTKPPTAMQAISLTRKKRRRPGPGGADDAPKQTAPAASELIAEPSIRGRLASFFTRELDVEPADLRMDIRGADPDVLRAPREGLRLVVQLNGAVENEIVEVTIRGWRGTLVESTWILRVGLEQRARALVATKTIRAGATLDAIEHIKTAERWLSPRKVRRLVDRSAITACTAATRVPEGQVLMQHHLELPVIVKRGDSMKVRCLVGGLEITIDAEARSPGALGQTIELCKLGERELFAAVVAGPGEAVVDLGR